MKKFVSIALSLMMLFVMSTTAFAAGTPSEATTHSTEIEIPVVYFDNSNEYEQYLAALEKGVSSHRASKGKTVLSAAVIRNGTSDDCELYMNWTGDELYSGFRFKEMEVKSTSILFAKTYGTFGNGSSYTYKYVVAAAVGSVKIGDVEIDSDVEKVKVTCKDMQGYNLTSASWLSAVELTGTVTIN